ncbi:ABC transporter permease [Shimazuella alba]|uniref:ABC transporter permease subunit n=1 Tax=Shimazuella alba TaxID=2690964 RepID=A0A6I4VQW3_9BACL|nr:ABC transporter permease [Shimazuella alba]MXQ52791.1 ABC transporter permease subunit [Shimazuella alba]
MLKLIKLEYRKAQLKALIISSILAIPILIYWCVYNKSGHPDGYDHYENAFADIHYFVSTTFAIIAAVFISKIVLEEYRSKTISILFTYPHSRRRLMIAKLIFISTFVFVSTIVSSGVIGTVFVVENLHTIADSWTNSLLMEEVIRTLLFAMATVGICLVSYYIGMLRKSVPATIIPPFLITVVSSDFYYGGSLSEIVWISIGWVVLGIVLAYMSIRKIEKSDIQ